MGTMKRWEVTSAYDQAMETREWTDKIPYIKFPSHWEIKMVPPFAGATVRFVVRHNEKQVSVYLDCYSMLGAVDTPYWEIYPDEEDSNARFALNETEQLLAAIKRSLEL